MSDELTPITRKETFLAKAGGQNVVTPTPITREEIFLQAIIDNGGGGGGTGGGVLVVNATGDPLTLDKTWNEIYDAMKTGSVAIEIEGDGIYPILSVYTDMDYFVSAQCGEYISSSPTDYPSIGE